MRLEIDHIFCFCSPTLPEVKILERAGLKMTSQRKHQGQGTANQCILLGTKYLELIYLDSEADALTNPLHLHLRANWKTTKHSPLGIALRGEIPIQDQSQFWDYNPPYYPGVCIKIHNFNKLHPEFPLLFVMPQTTNETTVINSPTDKTKGISSITVKTPYPVWPLSTPIEGLKLEKSNGHKMEVQIKHGLDSTLELNELLTLTAT